MLVRSKLNSDGTKGNNLADQDTRTAALQATQPETVIANFKLKFNLKNYYHQTTSDANGFPKIQDQASVYIHTALTSLLILFILDLLYHTE